MNTLPRLLLGDDHEGFRQAFRRFLEQEVQPHHADWETQGMVDRELWRRAGALGYLCASTPEQYGGAGVDERFEVVIMEEVARAGASGLGFSLHSEIVAPYILAYGSESQKQHYLPRLASGEMVGAIAMTEPGAGSDLAGVRSTAQDCGEHYLLNGSKTFITNGWHADLVIVVAKTDPSAGAKGVSLLLVERGMPGFERGQRLHKVGMKAQDTSELFFNDVKVPKAQLLGQPGQGFACLMQKLPWERLQIAVMAVASARRAIELTLEYVQQRHIFGKPVAHFQNTRFKLAQMHTEMELGQAFVDRCMAQMLQGELTPALASMAKAWCTEMQGRVLDECVQLHGGYGYMWEQPIARAWADARVQRIYGGTTEVMWELVARSMGLDAR
ncbi:acyl-CoA dehydrogenase family protein [Roseateles sp. BYS180W]|uniref:Acyl-CoA dehydrogenase family protein n=1 Tax=Roseateles rivi TaxID=3299028 RepID=A0ABW7FX71_9BURK